MELRFPYPDYLEEDAIVLSFLWSLPSVPGAGKVFFRHWRIMYQVWPPPGSRPVQDGGKGLRLLFVTDTHLRGNSPRSRRDDFPATQREKLQEVVGLARDHRVDVLIHGGDLWENPYPALAVCADYLSVLLSAPVPWLVVSGNHDVFGHNPSTLPRTMLGFLEQLGLVEVLRPGCPVVKEKSGLEVQFSGQPFHHQMDRRDPALDYCVDRVDADVGVHVVHGMLVDRPLPYPAAHTLVSDLPGTRADLTLAGHYHLGFGPREKEGKWFVNPGAMVRISNHPQEMERHPQVLLADIGGPGQLEWELIPLQRARPAGEVLDRSQLEARMAREEKLSQFVQQVQAAGHYGGLNLGEIIRELAQKETIPPQVREEALRRLEKAQEDMEMGEEDSG